MQWVLSSQHARGDEDTDKDDITEETVVANPMAEDTKPVERAWEGTALASLSPDWQLEIFPRD